MFKEKLKELTEKSIKELQKGKKLPDFDVPEVKISYPQEKKYGDYSTNIAMILAKKIDRDPMQIAGSMVLKLRIKNSKLFDRIETAKPGFINFFIAKKALLEELKKILREKEKYGKDKSGKGKRMVIDYSSPNIAKFFGIGHLRSTIIGQALYNIYQFLGWKCIGDNHLGDWGTQFGKLIVAIKKWQKEEKIKDLSIGDLEKLYIRFHRASKADPRLEEESRKWFKKLEQGDKEAVKIWRICVNVSLKEFNRIYRLLGIKIDYALGESFYLPMLEKIIQEAKDKKLAKKSQGAWVIEYPDNEFPLTIILKSDGATTYLTRDLATAKYRLKKWNPNLIIYEVGSDQTLYFKQLFRTIELLSWSKKEKFIHVAHGLIRSKSGKFSTRKGETIHLQDVLKEAVLRARRIIDRENLDRRITKERKSSEKEKEKVAKMIGIGAIKYNDLKQQPIQDVIFDWQKILNFKGDSAPYLQYTFARCQSVLRKSKKKVDAGKLKIQNLSSGEEEILKVLIRFPEVVKEAAERFSPNLICNFAFDLASKYNLFYNFYPIIKIKDKKTKNFRLALTKAVAETLRNSLSLLGISAPDKM